MAAGNSTSTNKLLASERRQRALELRRRGYSYPMIAADIGCSLSTAHTHVKTALQEIVEKTREDAEHVRTVELERLDQMLRGVWDKASDGDPQAVDRVLKVMERRAKLLGLDVPTSLDLRNPDGSLTPPTTIRIVAAGEEPTAEASQDDRG